MKRPAGGANMLARLRSATVAAPAVAAAAALVLLTDVPQFTHLAFLNLISYQVFLRGWVEFRLEEGEEEVEKEYCMAICVVWVQKKEVVRREGKGCR